MSFGFIIYEGAFAHQLKNILVGNSIRKSNGNDDSTSADVTVYNAVTWKIYNNIKYYIILNIIYIN